MKGINYIKHKQLKRYDIGKMPMLSGYQRSELSPTAGFSNSPGYNMSNEVSTVRNANTANALTQIGTTGKNVYDIIKGGWNLMNGGVNAAIKTGLAVTAANNAALATGQATMSGGATFASAANGVGNTVTGAAPITVSGTLDVGTAMNASSAAAAGSAAASYVTGGIGAALGTYGLINDAIGFQDRLKENDMMNMSGRGTASKYGVQYNTYNGLDAHGIRDYTSAQNSGSTLSMSMNGLGTGAGIGSIIGTAVLPGIGTLIGTGIGAVAGGISGLIGGLAGSSSRSKKVEESINNTLAAQHGYNLQAESKAGSQGLRNQYNVTHADKGKNIQLTNDGQQGELRMVHTSEGIVPGVMLGLAGKGESIYDPVKGTASVFDEGKKRVDNIPTGVSLNELDELPNQFKYDAGGAWNRKVIFGNNINPTTGNTFAEDAEGPSRVLENYNKGKNKMNLSKHTELVNRKNAMNQLNVLADLLSKVSQYNCGKAGKFANGKPVAPELTFLQAPFMMKEYYNALKQQPYALNSYIANPTGRQALDIMAASKFDPTTLLDRARQLSRQRQYSINQQGGLTSGQKLQFSMGNALDLMNLNSDILYRKQEADNARNASYASTLMKYGADEATRQMSALAAQQEAYARAVGAKQKWTSEALKNMSQIIPGYLQNRSTYDNFIAMKNLWDRQISLDEQKFANQLRNQTGNRVLNIKPKYVVDDADSIFNN